MSASSPPDTQTPSSGGPTRLNGWKEIAAYLDRGVRTVQRWEKEFDLPVRRLGPGRGEGVFAFAHELDAWQATPGADRARQSNSSDSPDIVAPDQEASGPASASATPGSSARGSWQFGMVLLAVAVVLLGVWVVWSTLRSPVRNPTTTGVVAGAAPASLTVDVDTLVVYDAQKREIWRHRFPHPLAAPWYAPGNPYFGSRLGIDDVDGDGRREVWILAIPSSGFSSEVRTLYLFEEHGGTPRWTYHFTGEATFGLTRFPPPWFTSTVFVTKDPAGGSAAALWVVSQEVTLFPAVLQRIDPKTGKPLSTYWSNGYITSVALARVDGRPLLLVGACNNETKGSALAVLDALNPNGVAPSETDEFRCTSCEGAAPETFLVFPKPARFGAFDMAGAVISIAVGPEQITLVTNHGQSRSVLLANGVYTLDTSFRPIAVALADQYLVAFKALVDEGSVPAGSPDRVDPDREFLPLKRWDDAAKRYVPVPLAPQSR